MARPVLQGAVIALVFFCLGVATWAGAMALVPNPGSTPAIFDDFNFSSTSNGYWHVNPLGATARIKDGLMTLSGHSIELDHRLQTDPHQTVVVAKVRGLDWDKFAVGLGLYHSGTVSIEFDSDGIKCGRGTTFGWKIDYLKGWKVPPTGKWFYLAVKVVNPYPNVTKITPEMKLAHPVTLTCAAYDAGGRPLAAVRAASPPPNTDYASLDEAYFRTWDSHNKYQLDWIYAGPPSGNPAKSLLR
jgi:hypothetical protein